MAHLRTPQAKKQASYIHDSRTQEGHSQKGLRQARKRSKAGVNRQQRRALHAALDVAPVDSPLDVEVTIVGQRRAAFTTPGKADLRTWVVERKARRVLGPLVDSWREPYSAGTRERVTAALLVAMHQPRPISQSLATFVANRMDPPPVQAHASSTTVVPSIRFTRNRAVPEERRWMARYFGERPDMREAVMSWIAAANR